jgi:hypothetical protein
MNLLDHLHLLLLLASSAFIGGVLGSPQSLDLNNFTAIRSCLPFTLFIKPLQGANATVKLVADEAVAAATHFSVDSDGVLSLWTERDFATNHTINLTVTVKTAGNLSLIENLGLGLYLTARIAWPARLTS